MNRVQKVAEFAEKHKDDYEAFYAQYLSQGAELNSRSQRQELEKHQKRVRELDSILKKIVEQNALGSLTDERFAVLSAEYESEQRELNDRIGKLSVLISDGQDDLRKAELFHSAISKYSCITELTATMLNGVIDRIEIHQGVGKGKERTQNVDIYWRFIGLLPD